MSSKLVFYYEVKSNYDFSNTMEPKNLWWLKPTMIKLCFPNHKSLGSITILISQFLGILPPTPKKKKKRHTNSCSKTVWHLILAEVVALDSPDSRWFPPPKRRGLS